MDPKLRKEAEYLLKSKFDEAELRHKTPEQLLHEIKVHQTELELKNEELRKNQENLEKSQQKYYNLFELAPLSYLILNSNSHIIEANHTTTELLNTSKKELRDRTFTSFIQPEYQEAFHIFFTDLIRENRKDVLESCLIVEGQQIIVHISGNPEQNSKSETLVRLTLTDITRESHYKVELEKTKERLELSLMAGNVAWWVWDYPSQIVTFDKKKAEMLGYTDGRTQQNVYEITSLIHPDDYAGTMQHMRQHLEGKIPQYRLEYRLKTLNGTYKWFYDHGSVTKKDAEGKPLKIAGVVIDITEKKSAELKLQELNEELNAQKHQLEEFNKVLEERVKDEVEKNRKKDYLMSLQGRHAAMGEIIGYIAHQWKQPLSSLNLVVTDLPDALAQNELTSEYLAKSVADASRMIKHMAQTIDDFREFFNPMKETSIFDVKEQTQKALSFIQGTITYAGIRTEYNLQKNLYAHGFPNEYSQVVINIASNARDALMDNKPEQPIISIASQKVGDTIRITFYNNGGPIPDQVMEHIFEPYYTTKEQKQGSGIGLYLARAIIEQNMKGQLNVKNHEQGVEFEILLPLSAR